MIDNCNKQNICSQNGRYDYKFVLYRLMLQQKAIQMITH